MSIAIMKKRRQISEEDQAAARSLSEIWTDYKLINKAATQESVAGELGMTQGAFGQYIRGEISFGMEATFKFANFFKVPIEKIKPFKFLEHGFNKIVSFSDPYQSLRNLIASHHADDNEQNHKKLLEPEYAEILEIKKYITLNQDIHKYDLSATEGYCRLPALNTQASAGPGCLPQNDEPETLMHVDILESYIRKNLRSNPKNLKIITARGQSMRGIIEDGDILFVEPGNTFTSDGIYIIATGDWVRVKQLRLSVLENRVFIESTDGSKESISGDEIDTLHICGRVVGSWNLKRF